MKNINIRWIFLGIAVLLFISMQGTLPKEAVADIEGKPCSEDVDCPCLGEYNYTTIENATAWGIGVGKCDETNNTCDMTYCVDLQPVGAWTRDRPFAWVKDNILVTFLIIGSLVMYAVWPKM